MWQDTTRTAWTALPRGLQRCRGPGNRAPRATNAGYRDSARGPATVAAISALRQGASTYQQCMNMQVVGTTIAFLRS